MFRNIFKICPFGSVISTFATLFEQISPQFHATARSPVKRRRVVDRRHGNGCHVTDNTNKTILTRSVVQEKKCAIPALNFVSDMSPIASDTSPVSCVVTKHVLTCGTVAKIPIIVGNSDTASCRNVSPPSGELVPTETSFNKAHSLTLCSQNIATNFDIDTPDMDWNDVMKNFPTDINTPVANGDARNFRSSEKASTNYHGTHLSVGGSFQSCRELRSGHFSHATESGNDDNLTVRTGSGCNSCEKNTDRSVCICSNVRNMLSSVLALTPPPSADRDKCAKVLVYDTPTAEYDFSYRKRMLHKTRLLRQFPAMCAM